MMELLCQVFCQATHLCILLLKQQYVCLPFIIIIIIIMGHGFCYTLFFLNPFSDEKGWSMPWLMRVCGLIWGFPSSLFYDFFWFIFKKLCI
jgi:hypothetical protein